MTSNRPYLIRAFYDWIVDNECTPHLLVDAYQADVSVPQSYVTDGQIVLNIAPRSVQAFSMDNEAVSFNTRFGGVPTEIYVPVKAILGIYARENGQGMVFEPDHEPEAADAERSKQNPSDDTPPKSPTSPGGGKRRLRVVK